MKEDTRIDNISDLQYLRYLPMIKSLRFYLDDDKFNAKISEIPKSTSTTIVKLKNMIKRESKTNRKAKKNKQVKPPLLNKSKLLIRSTAGAALHNLLS